MRNALSAGLAIALALLVLTVYAPWWPELVYYVVLMWFGCPSFNILSTSCGEFTAAFVIGHYVIPLAVLLWIACVIWKNRK